MPSNHPTDPLLFGPDGKAYNSSREETVPQAQRSEATVAHWYRNISDKGPEFWQAVAAWSLVVLSALTVYIAQGTLAETASQVAIMQRQLAANSEYFRISERAWVELEPVKPVLLAPARNGFPSGFQYDIFIRNVGNTPARNVTMKVGSLSRMGELDSAEESSRIQSMMLSGAIGAHIDMNVPSSLAPNAATPVPVRVTGQAPVYFEGAAMRSHLIGRIEYLDVFSVKHWKTFCFFVATPRGELWHCKVGNDQGQDPDHGPTQPPQP